MSAGASTLVEWISARDGAHCRLVDNGVDAYEVEICEYVIGPLGEARRRVEHRVVYMDRRDLIDGEGRIAEALEYLVARYYLICAVGA